MTIESIFYLTLGVAVTATEIALISSYYRIKGQIMFYPLFLVVATIGVVLGGSLLPASQFSKLYILAIIYISLYAFCGHLPSILNFMTLNLIAAINGMTAALLFPNNIPMMGIFNITVNSISLYIIYFMEIKLDIKQSIKKVLLVLISLSILGFSVLFHM